MDDLQMISEIRKGNQIANLDPSHFNFARYINSWIATRKSP